MTEPNVHDCRKCAYYDNAYGTEYCTRGALVKLEPPYEWPCVFFAEREVRTQC